MSATVPSGHGPASPEAGRRRLRGAGRQAPNAAQDPARPTWPHFGRAVLLVSLSLAIAVFCLGSPRPARAASPWAPVNSPFGASSAVNDVCAFGTLGLAAVGDDGQIAISRNAGRTWSVAVLDGLESAVLTTIAVDSSGRGVVASGGLLLVRDGWGGVWHLPSYTGPGPRSAINDAAMRGLRAVAVGDEGSILESADGGATWSAAPSPTASRLTSVAIAGDGTAVAGSASGEVLVAADGAWTVAGAVSGGVTSVAAASAPVWGDGRPDLFATDGDDVRCSDDRVMFLPLPGLPDLSSQSWPTMVCPGVPECSLLLAGAPNAGCFEPLTQQWLAGSLGLAGAACAVAPGSQSVAYVLGIDGRLVRTLSAGYEAATAKVSKTRIVVGGSARLTANVRVGAPGEVRVRQRVPGRSWTTLKKLAWTSADWHRNLAVTLKPRLTHDYRLEFRYGGAAVVLAAPVKVAVAPKVTTTTASLRLRVGAVYRLSGTVTPRLPGEKVYLYTDRGGSWRRVSLQGAVKLKDGRTWVSRAFGTPKAETYHLRARVLATRAHEAAWSRIVTVTIR